jgi:hypothetical protein
MAERSVRSLILRARAYDSKEQVDDYQADPDTAEVDSVESLLTGHRDPIRDEIRNWIDCLDEEGQVELVALYWIGRGDYEGREFVTAVSEARARRSSPTAGYLLGAPMLGDYLEAGLDAVLEAGVVDDA